MPEHVKEWFMLGAATLDVALSGGQSRDAQAEHEADKNRVTIYSFDNTTESDRGFKKLETKHSVHCTDMLETTGLKEVLDATPRCTGAIVHTSKSSPETPLTRKQIVTLVRHMLLFAADHMAILVRIVHFNAYVI